MEDDNQLTREELAERFAQRDKGKSMRIALELVANKLGEKKSFDKERIQRDVGYT